MVSSGSIPVPRLFDIRRPSGALIVEWMLIEWNGISPINSIPAITILASQRKMIPRSVELTSFGYQVSSSGVRSGQPSVANGQSADENQVSSTSSSCARSFEPHVSHTSGADSDAVVWPSGQYQTGMRCPHQSWRETHHGRMFS